MEITFIEKGISSFTSTAQPQSQIVFDKQIQSEIAFLQDNDEVFIYSKPVVSTYDKLLTEIKVIEVAGGDVWTYLALDYTSDPVLLVSNPSEEIYSYVNLEGSYYRKLDYVLELDTFYKYYIDGLLSEKLAERSF